MKSEVGIEDFEINEERACLIRTEISSEQIRHNRNGDLVDTEKNRATITDLFCVNNSKNLSNTEGLFQILSIELPVRGKDKVLEAIAELKKSEIVYSAEPDYNYTSITDWSPNDTDFLLDQWGLNGPSGIDAELAWNLTRGNANERVGIMEGGFDVTHNDLAENVLTLPGGFTPNPSTNLEHGTHVAGIVGAVANNSIGIAGIAQVSLVPLDWDNFVGALSFAANNEIWIINGSFGIYITDSLGNITGHASDNSYHAAAIYNYGLKDPTLTAAMVDRLAHKATVINIKGDSYGIMETREWLNIN